MFFGFGTPFDVWMNGRAGTDVPRVTIMAIAACVVLLVPSAWGQVGMIVLHPIPGNAARILRKK